jgi:hypothetical protein
MPEGSGDTGPRGHSDHAHAAAPAHDGAAPRAGAGRVGHWIIVSVCAHVLLFFALSLTGSFPEPLSLRDPAAALFGFVDVESDGDGRHGPAPPAPAPATEPITPPSPPKAKRAPRVTHEAAADALRMGTPSAREAGDNEGADVTASAEGTASAPAGDGLLGDGGTGDLGFAPHGAQIGLQIHIDRVRQSSLVLETEALMRIVPAWRELLRGSGLRSFEDLDRVFVATPDLDRASLVLAGHLRAGDGSVRAATARLAKSRGATAAFAPMLGLVAAPWYGPKDAERSIILLGGDRFVITRTADVARVVDVLRAIDARTPAAAARTDSGELAESEALVLIVEDVARFSTGTSPAVPRSLRLAVAPIDELYASLRVTARYASAGDAEVARAAVEEARVGLLDHAKIAELGLRSAFEEVALSADGRDVRATARVTLHQTRYLLSFAAHALRPRASGPHESVPDPNDE